MGDLAEETDTFSQIEKLRQMLELPQLMTLSSDAQPKIGKLVESLPK
jgi:hypothetical protein